MNSLLQTLNERLESNKKALLSNKDDTSNLIVVISEMQAEIDLAAKQAKSLAELVDYYKSSAKNSNRFCNICIPVTCSIPIAIGAIELINGNTSGLNYIKAGAAALFSIELIYQGGHFLVKAW